MSVGFVDIYGRPVNPDRDELIGTYDSIDAARDDFQKRFGHPLASLALIVKDPVSGKVRLYLWKPKWN